MELNKVINNRRSIRKYKQDLISEKDILEILNNARLSPSAHNRQPWQYLVFQNDKKEELVSLIESSILEKNELTYYEKIMRNCLKFIKDAPVFILVFSTLEKTEINDYLSLGASIENICLSSTNLGIGSLWLGVILEFEEIIKKHFNIGDLTLVSSIVLGYPDEKPEMRPRKDITEIVKFM